MPDAVVELREVWKVFQGPVVAVRDVSLSVLSGEFVSLLGPSGCGKTTTLRMVAGFEIPTAGQVVVAGKDVTGLAPKDRHVGMVFQQYALFPHLNVFENIAFGLRIRRVPGATVKRQVAEYLSLVQLPGYEARYPKQLSGGEQQRVSLARALITEPKVLLLDEPLGALDRKLREEMQLELKEMLRRVNITALFVTHDQDEALVMSDRVAVMNQGLVEQLDSPRELYDQPRTPFVATFVGTSNLLDGTLRTRSDGARVFDTGELCLILPEGDETGTAMQVAIRPERVRIELPGAEGTNCFPGVVRSVKFFGSRTQVRVELPSGQMVIVDVLNSETQDNGGTGPRPRETASRAYGSYLAQGQAVSLCFPVENLRLLESTPTRAAGTVPGKEAVR